MENEEEEKLTPQLFSYDTITEQNFQRKSMSILKIACIIYTLHVLKTLLNYFLKLALAHEIAEKSQGAAVAVVAAKKLPASDTA